MKNLVSFIKLVVLAVFLLAGSVSTEAIEQINQKEQQWWVKPPNENEPVARLVNEKRAAMAVQKIKEKGAEAVSKDFLDGVYYVVEGDCLYDLSGEFLKSKEWETLQEKNPFLKESTRLVKRNSKTVILLYPGEELLGLTPNIPLKNAEVAVGAGSINNQPPLEEAQQLMKLASIASILLAIGVVIVLMWLLYNYRKINKSKVASSGPPMRNPVLMYTGIPVNQQELTGTANRLRDISRNGGRLAVIYKTTLSCKKIPVEYSGETKSVVFNEEPIYMGVFERNKKITDGVLFHGYCLNGILFGEMDTPQLQEAVKTFEFGQVAEVSFGDKESDEGLSYQDAIDWLQNTYGKKQENTAEEKPEIVVAEKKPATNQPSYVFDKSKEHLTLEIGETKFTLTGCTNATVEEIGPNKIAVTAFIKNNAIEILVDKEGITITPKTQEKKQRNTKRNNVIEMPSREA